MEIEVIAAKRELQGTGASRRLRHAGKVPGIVYGGDAAPVQIELDHNALYHALRKEAFHASVLTLNVDGAKESFLLRDSQWHPYKQQVLHVDFQRVDKDHKIHVKVPLHFLNADVAPGVKTGGGKAHHIVNELDVSVCLAVCRSSSRWIWANSKSAIPFTRMIWCCPKALSWLLTSRRKTPLWHRSTRPRAVLLKKLLLSLLSKRDAQSRVDCASCAA